MMLSPSTRKTIAGFGITILILGVLFWAVGIEQTLAEIRSAHPFYIGGSLLAVLGWLFAWSLALRTVLKNLDVGLSIPRSFVVFAGAMFANNITPFGQAGGEPITALLLSRAANLEYERGLAAIASVDTLNFIPSIVFAVFGLGYYTTTVSLGSNLTRAGTIVGGLAIAGPLLFVTGWRYRHEIKGRTITGLSPIRRLLNRLPGVSIQQGGLEQRVHGFFTAIERIASNPRLLLFAIAFSTLGWLCHTLALWSAFRAVGTTVPLTTLLFVVPIGAIAGVTPLPGGLGGIESVLITLLVGIGIGTATAASAVIIYRGFIYWVPTTLGGGAVTLIRSYYERA